MQQNLRFKISFALNINCKNSALKCLKSTRPCMYALVCTCILVLLQMFQINVQPREIHTFTKGSGAFARLSLTPL